MARVTVEPGVTLQCDVDDYLWPWDTATPVLMQHGFARSAEFWRPWVPIVAQKHRVYRPELRGFGRSDVPAPDYRYDAAGIVRDIVILLDILSLQRVHWVGESSGGLIGFMFAAAHPERVASIVVCDSPVRIPDAVKQAYSLDQPTVGDAIRTYGVGEWSRRTLADRGRLDTRHASPELQDWYVKEMNKTPVYAAANIFDFFASVDVTSLLPSITCPVLSLSGEDSTVASSAQGVMLDKLPNVRRTAFPGYSHGVSVVAAKACANAATQFWTEL